MDYSNVAFIGKNSESHNWNDPCKKRKINLIIHKHCKLDWSPPDKLEANETFNSKLACSYYESNTNRLFWWQLCNHLSTNSNSSSYFRTTQSRVLQYDPLCMVGKKKKAEQAKRKTKQVLFPKHYFIIEGSCFKVLGFLALFFFLFFFLLSF